MTCNIIKAQGILINTSLALEVQPPPPNHILGAMYLDRQTAEKVALLGAASKLELQLQFIDYLVYCSKSMRHKSILNQMHEEA